PREIHDLVADLVAALKPVLDGIAATGNEDSAAMAAFRAGHPGVFEPGGPAAAPPRRLGDILLREAREVFAGHAEVLAYFGPETTELLETITRMLVDLEQRGADPSEADVPALFRAVHTLKGAAYTVGCEAIAQIAHRAEDVLDAVRDRRLRWSPAVMDTLFQATEAIKTLLDGADVPGGDPATVVEDALQGLAALSLTAGVPADEALQVEACAESTPEPTVEEPARVASTTAPTLTPAMHVPGGPPDPPGPAQPTIRVNVRRLDTLMNLV